LSPRLRANLQELGISKLLQGSKYALSDIQAWLLDHENHPWASGTQLYAGGGRVQGPSQGARLVEFFRAYPAYRIPLYETRAVAHRVIWAAVVTQMVGSALDGRKSDVHTTDDSTRLPAVPRLRSVPLADQLLDCDPYAIESQDLHSGYIRDSCRFTAADPDPLATIPYQWESEMDRDITPSLHRRLEEFRLEATVAYYAPRTMGNVSNVTDHSARRRLWNVSLTFTDLIPTVLRNWRSSIKRTLSCDDALPRLRNVPRERQLMRL
jgi:hypothetical protein